MSTNKPRKDLTSESTVHTRGPAAAGVLGRLAGSELATVLRILLERHPNLSHEADEIAVGVVSSPSTEDIADEVCTSVTGLDMDDLNQRAGKHSWGYMEPGEAAQELLEEAVAEYSDDMKRRMDLGLEAASETICVGIVEGLFRASGKHHGQLLEWAPDFPVEHAGYVIEEYLAKSPTEKRRAAGDRLANTLSGRVPEWSKMINRAARGR